MTEQYPVILPPFQIDSYGYDDDNDLIRTDIDGGPTNVNRRSNQSGSVFSVNSRMTYDQFKVFEAWYKYKIGNGSCWFTVTLAVGKGLVEHTGRFVGKYSPKLSGSKYWMVAAKIEVDEKQMITKEELAALIGGIDPDAIGMWNFDDNAANSIVTAAIGPNAVIAGGLTQSFHVSDSMEGAGAFNMGAVDGSSISVTSPQICAAIDSGTFTLQFAIKFYDFDGLTLWPVFIETDTLTIRVNGVVPSAFVVLYKEQSHVLIATPGVFLTETWYQYRIVFETDGPLTSIKSYSKTLDSEFVLTDTIDGMTGAIGVTVTPVITFFKNFAVASSARIADQVVFWNKAVAP